MREKKAKCSASVEAAALSVMEAAMKYGRLPDHSALDQLTVAAIAYANIKIKEEWAVANGRKTGSRQKGRAK